MIIEVFHFWFYTFVLAHLKVYLQHTFYHVTSHFIALPTLGKLIQCECLIVFFLNSLLLPSVPVFNNFVARYLVCNARYCAAIFSLSVSAFIYPVNNHKKAPSSLIIYVHIQFHCILHTLIWLPIFSLRILLHLSFYFACLPFLSYCFC